MADGRPAGPLKVQADIEQYRAALAREIAEEETKAGRRISRWNLYYYVSLYGSITLGAFAALVPQLDSLMISDELRKDLGSVFAGLAALGTALLNGGAFERRWRAARNRKSRIHQIRIDLLSPSAELDDVRAALKQAVASYHQEALDTSRGADRVKEQERVA